MSYLSTSDRGFGGGRLLTFLCFRSVPQGGVILIASPSLFVSFTYSSFIATKLTVLLDSRSFGVRQGRPARVGSYSGGGSGMLGKVFSLDPMLCRRGNWLSIPELDAGGSTSECRGCSEAGAEDIDEDLACSFLKALNSGLEDLV